MNEGFSITPCQIAIKFLLRYTMGIMFGMFLFAFQVFITQKCEAVIFPKFKSACVHARPLGYLDVPSHWACTLCRHVHGVCASYKYGSSKYPSGLACTVGVIFCSGWPFHSGYVTSSYLVASWCIAPRPCCIECSTDENLYFVCHTNVMVR